MPKDYVQELVEIMAHLRAPDGCPWDREQTHESLKRYLVEESAELFDAMDEQDDEGIADELGDVLLQIVFHCRIGQEQGRFDLQQVARRCCEKMIRRHPHVFGEPRVAVPTDVVDEWDRIKDDESPDAKRTSAVDGVPRHLPALHRAQKTQKRAAKVGFDYPSVDGVLAKIEEELAEVRDALASRDRAKVAEEIGDLLFAVTNLSRFQDHQAEELLHDTVKKFARRFRRLEQLLAASGQRPQDSSLDDLEAAWRRTKQD